MAIDKANSAQSSVLSAKQTAIFHKLNRQYQIHSQKESYPLSPFQTDNFSTACATTAPHFDDSEVSLKDFIERRNVAQCIEKECKESEFDRVQAISIQFDEFIFKKWENSFKFAENTFHSVQEMENCHREIVTKTNTLLDTFANNLQQTESLEKQILFMQNSLSKFSLISQLAENLGYTAEFPAGNASVATKSPVKITRRRSDIDPTTQEFQSALESIEENLEFLAQHVRFRLSFYRFLMIVPARFPRHTRFYRSVSNSFVEWYRHSEGFCSRKP